jgi:RNA polymerase sigma-70 factor (ECF subfamily)
MSTGVDIATTNLLRLALGGSTLALGQLLDRYRNYLALLARVQIGRRLQGKVDAADLVQETFLEATRHFGQFRGVTEAEFVHWLRQILAARLVDLVRCYFGAQCRDVRLECQLEKELERSSRLLDGGLVSPQSSPSKQAARREQARALADALDRLPEDYREVLILHHFEACTFPEVARRIGRSVDSVEKLWVRALARLRRSMGGFR